MVESIPIGMSFLQLAVSVQCPCLQVRSYDVHRLLEERVKAMMLALPLVQDLHHSAMRDRHWLMLMKVRLDTEEYQG